MFEGTVQKEAGNQLTPDLEVGVWDRLTGGHIHNLYIHDERNPSLVVCDILPDVFASNVFKLLVRPKYKL